MKMRDYIAAEDRRLVRESYEREILNLQVANERLRRDLGEAERLIETLRRET